MRIDFSKRYPAFGLVTLLLRITVTIALTTFLCVSLQAQKVGTTSCTANVSKSDCTEAWAAFEASRDNKVFNTVDVMIADPWEFKQQKSAADQDRARRLRQGETGLVGPTALLSGLDQDSVLIFFEKTAVPSITRIVVSTEAFYKLNIGPDGKPKQTAHFDSESARALAEKINGYVVGWFFGQTASLR